MDSRLESVKVSAVATQRFSESSEASPQCGCGSTDLERLGRCRDLPFTSLNHGEGDRLGVTDSGYLFRCRTCHLGFRFPRPTEESLKSLYQSLDTERWSDEAEDSFAWRESWRYLAKRHRQGQSILDIGAFTGGFLRGLSDTWVKHAIEPSNDARRLLEESSIQVVGDLLSRPDDGIRHRFDVVTLFDVFEHLPDVYSAMRWINELTKPGGLIVISTGNMDHWSWRALAGGHWYVDPMQHLCFGSKRFFEKWAIDRGLEVVQQVRIPHGGGKRSMALWETMASVYFFSRRRNSLAAKLTRRMLQSVPSLRSLRHKKFCPYTRNLRDHVLVFIRVPE